MCSPFFSTWNNERFISAGTGTEINNGYRESERGRDPGGTVRVMIHIPELYCTHLCPKLCAAVFWELLRVALKRHQGVEMMELQEALVSANRSWFLWCTVGFLNGSLIDAVMLRRFSPDVLLFSGCLCLITASFLLGFGGSLFYTSSQTRCGLVVGWERQRHRCLRSWKSSKLGWTSRYARLWIPSWLWYFLRLYKVVPHS